MNGIAAFADQLTLVLDDFHTVTNGECLASIAHAVAHFPSAARLIVITRVDPALELGGLRASGALREVRASELRSRLLRRMNCLSTAAVCGSMRRTWMCW